MEIVAVQLQQVIAVAMEAVAHMLTHMVHLRL